jgi:hypothetical protein
LHIQWQLRNTHWFKKYALDAICRYAAEEGLFKFFVSPKRTLRKTGLSISSLSISGEAVERKAVIYRHVS